MNLVQRDTQLIVYRATGLWDEPGICNNTVSVSLGQNQKFILLGLSIKYEMYCDSGNGDLEFEIRDFLVIDLKEDKVTSESLYDLVEQSANNSYAILLSESLKNHRGAPPKPPLKKVEIITALNLELDDYYNVS